jgi:hypothetical protein
VRYVLGRMGIDRGVGRCHLRKARKFAGGDARRVRSVSGQGYSGLRPCTMLPYIPGQHVCAAPTYETVQFNQKQVHTALAPHLSRSAGCAKAAAPKPGAAGGVAGLRARRASPGRGAHGGGKSAVLPRGVAASAQACKDRLRLGD